MQNNYWEFYIISYLLISVKCGQLKTRMALIDLCAAATCCGGKLVFDPPINTEEEEVLTILLNCYFIHLCSLHQSRL